MGHDDMSAYCERFGISHSDCYERWGFTRTGCVGCPFNRHVFEDLEVVRGFEPNMHRAACRVFEDAYEYTRMFADFKARMRDPSQMRLF